MIGCWVFAKTWVDRHKDVVNKVLMIMSKVLTHASLFYFNGLRNNIP